MSRINDALRRAKQAQKNAPRVPAPALPATSAGHMVRRQSDFSLPLLLALAGVMVLAGGLISLALFRHGPASPERGANTFNTAPLPVRAQEPAPAAPLSALPAAPAVTPPATTAVAVAAPSPAPSTAAPPTRPASPRLQGIFYRPDRPTAIIDGKTVRPGASIGGYQVMDITFDTVIIGNAAQTNVLHLPE